jgi:hypothetical protein
MHFIIQTDFYYPGYEVLTAVAMKICLLGYNTVYPVKVSDISEEHLASIFRVEEYSKPETIMM